MQKQRKGSQETISCCCSVAKSCLTLYNPMDCSMPGFPVLHYLLEFAQTHVHWVSDAMQPSDPLLSPLLPPSIFHSIRVFSNESALHIRWPKYWHFSFNISPSNEHPGLISFRMDWLDLLAVQGALKSPLAPWFKSIDSLMLSLLHSPTLTSIHDTIVQWWGRALILPQEIHLTIWYVSLSSSTAAKAPTQIEDYNLRLNTSKLWTWLLGTRRLMIEIPGIWPCYLLTSQPIRGR